MDKKIQGKERRPDSWGRAAELAEARAKRAETEDSMVSGEYDPVTEADVEARATVLERRRP